MTGLLVGASLPHPAKHKNNKTGSAGFVVLVFCRMGQGKKATSGNLLRIYSDNFIILFRTFTITRGK
jgi:hypothetical protein